MGLKIKSTEPVAAISAVGMALIFWPEPAFMGGVVAAAYAGFCVARALNKANRLEFQYEGKKTREFKGLWISYGLIAALIPFGLSRETATAYVVACAVSYLLNRGFTKHEAKTASVNVKTSVPPRLG